MTEAVKPMGSDRAEALAYVAAHMQDLQGAAAAPTMLVLAGFAAWCRVHGPSAQALWLIPVSIAAQLLGGRWIQRWYRRRFGYVQASVPDEVAAPSGLTLLSISSGEPVSKAVRGREARPAVRRQSPHGEALGRFWMGLFLFEAVLIVSTRPGHLHTRSASLLLPVVMLLTPRIFSAAPPSLALQGRRWLAGGGLALLLTLQLLYTFGPLAPWPLIGSVFAVGILITGYDHWLLLHFLGGTDPGGTGRGAAHE